MKRVVSLVPSWTETLIEAGALVVGRTRFCIHPAERVASIEAVGGTKSFDESKLRALAPDVIVLDREENTKDMFELASSIAPVVAVTHVERVEDVARELRLLASAFSPDADVGPAAFLRSMAERFENALAKPLLHKTLPVLSQLRGETSAQTDFIYVIWKDPWMCVNKNTFIGSMLRQAGFTRLWAPDETTKYPKLESLPEDKLILLSSEPYPFEKKTPSLPNANVAIVDGELFSWFGLRSLRFLESLK